MSEFSLPANSKVVEGQQVVVGRRGHLGGFEDHRRSPGTFDGSDHDVRLAEGSLAARCAGELLHGTKSHHHQGVARVGDGLEVTGWAVMDDLPEALRAGTQPPAIELGVQLNAQGREGGVFEVEMKLTAAARREAEAVFQIELVYAGLFQVVGVEQEDLEQVLMIECPKSSMSRGPSYPWSTRTAPGSEACGATAFPPACWSGFPFPAG